MVDYIVIFDYTVDIIFVIDLIMGFFTSVIDTKGFISFDSRVIAKVYTSQFRFYADFLSIFGSGWFEQISPNFKIFGFFKLIRVFRINGMIAKTNVEQITKSALNLSKLILFLLLYIHFVACYNWIIAGIDSGD